PTSHIILHLNCRRRSWRQAIPRDKEPNLRERCLLATGVALWPQRNGTNHSQSDRPHALRGDQCQPIGEYTFEFRRGVSVVSNDRLPKYHKSVTRRRARALAPLGAMLDRDDIGDDEYQAATNSCQEKFKMAVKTAILATQPTSYWPLDDAAGSSCHDET